ncbi:uncharacterized protein BKA55DRAFT_584583 [Fusarium redolens]|uniref:Uncharacterized protein n=1 Tax=Fusarium redolens TaxID=48865 RepID=A0A9P9JUD8_FUSRE|nr:uncharacterized protein BKA55DRAFT_584583 [Fusarium redolens]KAH7224415.1 hypothetical protein BKA55DRAFT_584583 [Fusarium redolens]
MQILQQFGCNCRLIQNYLAHITSKQYVEGLIMEVRPGSCYMQGHCGDNLRLFNVH